MNRPVSIALLAAVLLSVGACGGGNAAADPAAVLAEYEAARNAGDIDALVALFAEGAVIVGHPLDPDGEANSTELGDIETGLADSHASTTFLNIDVDGNTVTFDLEFVNTDRECFATVGNQITVDDGEITEFVWDPGAEASSEPNCTLGM